MAEATWKTAITKIEPNKILLSGYPIVDLMGKVTLAEAFWLALRGELPSRELGRLLDAILVSSIDHGVTPPSALACLTAASTGATLNAAVAAGVLAINRYHGGAIEDCMKALAEVRELTRSGQPLASACSAVASAYKARKERIAGFGHRVHTNDPRSARLFELARVARVAAQEIEIALSLEQTLGVGTGKKLPINVDGAIAAVLLGLGVDPRVANAFFIVARVPGLVAHALEEWSRQKPMRVISPTDHEYDGPPERKLER
ncbi:MAG: citryl-CoA lyase [Planctomycetota bacterium]